MNKCMHSDGLVIEIKGGKILIISYHGSYEIEVEKVKNVKTLRGLEFKECNERYIPK